MRRLAVALASVAVLSASPAYAALTIDPSAPAGTFENNNVPDPACIGTCNFEDMQTFLTPLGYGSVKASITSSQNGPGTDLNFTEVTLNGQKFTLFGEDIFGTETGGLGLLNLAEGAVNTLIVKGTSAGSGAYSGTLSFARSAVPEPGTWGMMLLGFAAVGFAMRRRREQNTSVALRFA